MANGMQTSSRNEVAYLMLIGVAVVCGVLGSCRALGYVTAAIVRANAEADSANDKLRIEQERARVREIRDICAEVNDAGVNHD